MQLTKRSKGLVALGAGAALLLGSAGTFALWYDTATIGANTSAIQTGDLNLAAENAGTWIWYKVSHSTNSITVPPTDSDYTEVTSGENANNVLVPGDAVKIKWAENANQVITAGTTLYAELFLDGVNDETGLTNRITTPLVVQKGVNSTSDGITTTTWTTVDADTVFKIDVSAVLVSAAGNTPAHYVAVLPEILVGFPADFSGLDGAAVYHAPNSPTGAVLNQAGSGYGRNRGSTVVPISLQGLTLRLQQVTTPGDTNVFVVPLATATP